MSTRTSCAVPGIALVLLLGVFFFPGLAVEKAAQLDAEVSAAELVRAALLAEIAGKWEDRQRLLAEALVKAPEYGLARWHSGQVRWGDQWVSLHEVAKQALAGGGAAEPGKARDALPGGPPVPTMVQEQAKRPKPPDLRQLMRTQLQKEREWLDYWTPRVAKWRRTAEKGKAAVGEAMRQELATMRDPVAIHALGTVLIRQAPAPQELAACRAMGLAMVGILDYGSEPWTAPQLTRYAVDYVLPEVRTAAADALKDRSKETYVPILLNRMRAPVEATFAVLSFGPGGVAYQQVLEWESAEAVYRETTIASGAAKPLDVRISRGTVRDHTPPMASQPHVVARNSAFLQAAARQRAAAAQRQVQAVNVGASDLNQRIVEALRRATGEELSATPIAWQKWWTRYLCEYYELAVSPEESESGESQEKPVYENSYQEWFGALHRVTVTSCFPRDTLVQTIAGPRPIDQLRPRDLVLSQHPRTGELAFRPVLLVTKRKPSPMIRITMGKDAILTTRGHPFWVCGEGWTMAKHLQAGQRLHAASGAVTIDRLEPAPAAGPWYDQLKDRPDAKPEDAMSYNLVVDEFHTYFVTGQRILVHDNILFPLDGPLSGLPGLTAP